jgi:hypothetical protein
MLDDFELDKLMRRADPARTPRSAPLTMRAEADLERITGRPAEVVPERRVAWSRRWFALPAIAFLFVVAFALVNVVPVGGHDGRARASTPPILTPKGENVPTGEAMATAIRQLSESRTEVARRSASYTAWYLNTEVGQEGDSSSTVEPRDIEVRWEEDQSGSRLITVGKPFATAPGTTEIPLEASSTEGDIVRDEKFSRAQFRHFFLDPPPGEPAAMHAYLRDTVGVVDETDPVEMLDAVAELMSYWTLTPAQHSAILQSLAVTPGVESYGFVDDRLGRAGFAFRVSSPEPDAPFYKLLVVGEDTGRILSIETVYLGGIAELTVEAPAVVQYVAWR